jgi:hypothetical protein
MGEWSNKNRRRPGCTVPPYIVSRWGDILEGEREKVENMKEKGNKIEDKKENGKTTV